MKHKSELFLGPGIFLNKFLDCLNVFFKGTRSLELQSANDFGGKAWPINLAQIIADLLALNFHLLRLNFVNSWIVLDNLTVNFL